MIEFILWYLFLSILGFLSFPITFKVLPFLADKGYGIARVVGLLIWSYLFWILTSFGILSNDIRGALIAFLILALLAFNFYRQTGKNEIYKWVQKQVKTLIVIEILFLFCFGFWTLFRSISPEILGTEKPMELAFISAISRSPSFPPSDPWLSGYAISYYHFGYIMVAILGYASGTAPTVSFNLAVSAWFALTALGCYGIVFNLLTTWQDFSQNKEGKKTKHSFHFSALLGPFFVLIISNLEGFLEMLHARGLFWQKDQDGMLFSQFWTWLNIQELNQPPSMPFSFLPNRGGGIWWWRASRVLQDFDINGVAKEVIDEFPFFSYFLGDLHPHLLAMPLGLLAVSIAINLFRGYETYASSISIVQWVKRPLFWLIALCCGGIIFANTWDLPIYLGLIAILFLIIRIQYSEWKISRIFEVVLAVFLIGITSFFLYLPFFLGFASQAGGILPSLNFFTPGKNFWVMFFPFLFLFFIFLFIHQLKIRNTDFLAKSLLLNISLFSLIGFFSYALAWFFGNFPVLMDPIKKMIGEKIASILVMGESAVDMFTGIHGGSPINLVVMQSLINRLQSPFTLLTLLLMLTFCIVYFFPIFKKGKEIQNKSLAYHNFGIIPVIVLIVMGSIFCLIPEFFYLRDVFGTRMNTIFKFYFQSWIVWGLASACAVVVVWHQLKNPIRKWFSIILIIVLLISCAYPIFVFVEKFRNFSLNDLSLDGSQYMALYNPDEFKAIEWLREAPYGIVAEAIGGSYSGFARVATFSGLPAVLGWPGHEMQWRGGTNEIGSREYDIRLLFETDDWQAASQLIQRYQIRYIYVGDLEKSHYNVNEKKFLENMIQVYKNDSVSIFQIPVIKK